MLEEIACHLVPEAPTNACLPLPTHCLGPSHHLRRLPRGMHVSHSNRCQSHRMADASFKSWLLAASEKECAGSPGPCVDHATNEKTTARELVLQGPIATTSSSERERPPALLLSTSNREIPKTGLHPGSDF
jgi:hypothetical protein